MYRLKTLSAAALPAAALFAAALLAFLSCPAHADGLLQNGDTAHPIILYAASSSNGNSPVTGLTLTLAISKNGGAFATPTGTQAEIGSGFYKYVPSAADDGTNGEFIVNATATGAIVNPERRRVVSVNPDDASLFGLTGVGTLAGQSALLAALAPFQSTVNDALSTTTVLDTALTGTADLTGARIVFTSGPLKGVTRTISAINAGTGQITLLNSLPSAPGNGVAFSVVQGSKALELFLAALGSDSKPFITATDTQAQAEAVAALTAQGYTGTRAAKLDNADVATSSRMAAGPVTVAGTVAANVTQIAGQTASAAGAVTFPGSIGTSTYAGGPVASVTGSVASVTGSVGSISGITFPGNFGTFNIDGSGRVTLGPGQSMVTSNLPTDYQQRGVPVSLPTTAPTGYGGGSFTGLTNTDFAGIWGYSSGRTITGGNAATLGGLAPPANFNLLAINGTGYVTSTNGGGGGGATTLASQQAADLAALNAQGTVTVTIPGPIGTQVVVNYNTITYPVPRGVATPVPQSIYNSLKAMGYVP